MVARQVFDAVFKPERGAAGEDGSGEEQRLHRTAGAGRSPHPARKKGEQ